MRPMIAVVIWLVLVGGLLAYVQGRETRKASDAHHIHQVTGGFALEITTTFDVEPDPFALTTDTSEQPAALLANINGVQAVRLTDKIRGGNPIRIDPVPGLMEGKNEIYVEANPPLNQAERSQAIRVRLLRDGHIVADHSFWSEQGYKIATTFPVFVEKALSAEKRHEH